MLRDDPEGEVGVEGDPGALEEVEKLALPLVVRLESLVSALWAAEGHAGARGARHWRHQSEAPMKR